jgi:hypothetical protein
LFFNFAFILSLSVPGSRLLDYRLLNRLVQIIVDASRTMYFRIEPIGFYFCGERDSTSNG